jgi:MFS family permease
MATIASEAGDRSIQIGRVFSRAFGTIGRNPVATLGIALLFSALPSMVIIYAFATLGIRGFASLGMTATIAVSIFSVVVFILLAMITQGALVRTTVAHSQGRKASFAESAMAGLTVVLPLFLLALLSALGFVLGLILLVVPGIILYVMWSVAAPALVEERLWPIEAIRRSHYLTRGARWKIFALMLVLVVIYWLFTTMTQMLSMMWFAPGSMEADSMGGPGVDPMRDAMSSLMVGVLMVSVVSGTITSAIWGVIMSSLYVELREWKDGPRTEQLADIFG